MGITYAGRGITRLDLEDSHNFGYMVRIFRNGQRFSAYFSDRKCGGKRNAKKQAQECYEKLVAKHGPANRQSCLNKITARNTTGVVGIHIATSTDTRWSGGTYKAYCASWINDDGSRGKLAFSWKKYGKKAAMEYAMYAREHRLENRNAVVTAVDKRSAKASVKKASTKAAPKKKASGKKKSR
jgi:hypothetical protein